MIQKFSTHAALETWLNGQPLPSGMLIYIEEDKNYVFSTNNIDGTFQTISGTYEDLKDGDYPQMILREIERDYNNMHPTPPSPLHEVDPTVPQFVKEITEAEIDKWNNSLGFDGNYEHLTHKPNIPSKVSDLDNDLGYITGYTETEPQWNAAKDNYYTKSQIDGSLADKADKSQLNDYTLTSGFATINNQSITNGGNIVISGGEGTTDYNALENKPTLNGQTLQGNVTLDIPSKVSQLQNDANYITGYTETDPTIPEHVKSITKNDINSWNAKSEFDGDYNSLENKPSIPSKVSELENDSEFVASGDTLSKDIDNISDNGKNNMLDFVNVDYYRKGYVNSLEESLRASITEYANVMKEIQKKVDELSTYKFPNVTIIGEPRINNGQISNFSASNYIQFPFLVDFHNQTFQIDMCFTTSDNVTDQQNILDSHFGLAFAIRNGHFVLAMSSNGQIFDMGEHEGTFNVEPNTTYYVKYSWNGSTYKVEVSDNINGEFITDITVNDSKSLYPTQIIIGKCNDNTFVFQGIINLNNCYLYIREKEVWSGMDSVGIATRLQTDLMNIDEVGVKRIHQIHNELKWYGTQEQYDAIEVKDPDIEYNIVEG